MGTNTLVAVCVGALFLLAVAALVAVVVVARAPRTGRYREAPGAETEVWPAQKVTP